MNDIMLNMKYLIVTISKVNKIDTNHKIFFKNIKNLFLYSKGLYEDVSRLESNFINFFAYFSVIFCKLYFYK